MDFRLEVERLRANIIKLFGDKQEIDQNLWSQLINKTLPQLVPDTQKLFEAFDVDNNGAEHSQSTALAFCGFFSQSFWG